MLVPVDAKIKKVAEFMGMRFLGLVNPDFYDYEQYSVPAGLAKGKEHLVHGNTILLIHAAFDKDPTWIWPVIEKIEFMGYKFQLCRRRATIKEDDDEAKVLFDIKGETKIAAAFEAACLFIDQYNEQQLNADGPM